MTSPHLLLFSTEGAEPEIGTPARPVSEAPQHRTWNLVETPDEIYSGIWESDVGEWDADYTEWEFCHVLAGEADLIEEGGEPLRVRAGDSFVIRRGFKGRWRVLSPFRKAYVIKL